MIAQEFYLPIVNPGSEQAGNHYFSPSPTTTTPRRRRSLPHTTYLLASRRHLTRKAKNLTQERGLSIASNECKFTSRVPVALIRGGRCYGHASKPQPSLFSISPPPQFSPLGQGGKGGGAEGGEEMSDFFGTVLAPRPRALR